MQSTALPWCCKARIVPFGCCVIPLNHFLPLEFRALRLVTRTPTQLKHHHHFVLKGAVAAPNGVCRCFSDEQLEWRRSQEARQDELRKHRSRESCWICIDSKVYDVTDFLDEHPGLDTVLLEYAGSDATTAFHDVGHSQLAQQMLIDMCVGTLSTATSKDEKHASPALVEEAKTKPTSSFTASGTKGSSLSAPQPVAHKRKKVALPPGCSAMDWMRLSNTMSRPIPQHFTLQDVAKHNKPTDAWVALNGRVYDVTQYLRFHPGGIPELMRGVGKDATTLFNEYHPYVNYTFLLDKFMVGILTN